MIIDSKPKTAGWQEDKRKGLFPTGERLSENSFTSIVLTSPPGYIMILQLMKSIQERESIVSARSAHGKIRSEIERGAKLSKCMHCGCMKGTLEEMKGLLSARRDKDSTELRRDVSSWLNRLEDTLYT
jgi:hypothetical protein